MPRISRDLSGRDLSKLLGPLGYEITRQSGSHIRMTAQHPQGTHQLTVPDHDPVKIGTLTPYAVSATLLLYDTEPRSADHESCRSV